MPIVFNGTVMGTDFETDSYTISVVDGWRPEREDATMLWIEDADFCQALLDTCKASRWQVLFTYNIGDRPVILRPMRNYMIRENHDGMWSQLQLTMRVVG